MATTFHDASIPQTGGPSTLDPDSTAETERAVSSDRFCDGCGKPLTGRRPQARFCANRCRTYHGRRARSMAVVALVTRLEDTLAELKRELGGQS